MELDKKVKSIAPQWLIEDTEENRARVHLAGHVVSKCVDFIQFQNMFSEETIKRIGELLTHDYTRAIAKGEFKWDVSRIIVNRCYNDFEKCDLPDENS